MLHPLEEKTRNLLTPPKTKVGGVNTEHYEMHEMVEGGLNDSREKRKKRETIFISSPDDFPKYIAG